MRLSVIVRSLDTDCLTAEGADRDAAKEMIFDTVPAGWEVVTVGYLALADTVRASAIIRSEVTEQLVAEGATLADARAKLVALIPPQLRGLAERDIVPV
ncbi:MAG: hypothetical protein V4737_13405 [Curtobacterium sp.]